MSSKSMFIMCAGVLFVGVAVLWSGNHAWAYDAPAANGDLQPVPSQSVPAAENNGTPARQFSYFGDTANDEYGECDECEGVDFCGFACCCPPGKFWLRADYLMWWTNGMRLPPLVTTSPPGTPLEQAGVLPNATVLFGDSTVGAGGRSGYRFSWGMWLDNCCTWGIEGDYFALGQGSGNYDQFSATTILARPLYDVQAIGQGRQLVTYPDVVEGSIRVNAKDYFQSTGVALSYNLCCCDDCCDSDPCGDSCLPLLFCCRTDLLIGYRYYKYNDSVAIRENLRVTEEGPTQNWLFQVDDNFRARNDFHGSEFGLRTKLYRGRWSLDILTKIALGNTRQTVTIDGQTIVTPTDQPTQIRDGGVFAVRSNEGTYTRDSFTMIPQLGIDLGYQVNQNWRAYIGYNLLYWACVVHAGEQIDLNVDPRNIPIAQDPALPFPAFSGKTSSFWAHGLNLGLEYRF